MEDYTPPPSINSNIEYNGGDSKSYTGNTSGNDFSNKLNYYETKAKERDYFNKNNYDHSGTNTYKVTDFTVDNINMENPYEEIVITGGRAWTTYDEKRGKPINIQDHYELYYGVNSAYKDFEKTIYEAQKANYENDYSKLESNFTSDLEYSPSDYDTASNSHSDAMQTLIEEINTLKKEDYLNTSAKDIADKYNRIDYTKEVNSHDDYISELESDLLKEKQLYDHEDYLDRYNEAKRKQEEADASNWEFSIPEWIVVPEPIAINYLKVIKQDPKAQMILNTTGEINRWMAGGDLYDAPRAGDVMFNVIGNMNTVRFLGLEDTNGTPDIVRSLANPDLFNMFGSQAGDKNFSIFG